MIFTPVVENKKYDLDALIQPDFHFELAPDSGIHSVRIMQATVTSLINPQKQIILKDCPDKNINAIK